MAVLGGDVPSFDGLLDTDQPKDTEVVLEEEDSGSHTDNDAEQQEPLRLVGQKRSREGTADGSISFSAHWVVLWSLSPFFRAKLERWAGTTTKRPRQQEDKASEQPQPYQYTLQLLVPPGQLDLGRRLITAMYSSSPDLSDLEAPQLMQLVSLAECYGVGKVVTAAATQLHTLSVETMPLATAAAVFELPEACLGLETFKGVQKTATDKLQQELGDLEVVWGDKGKQQALLGLPLAALLRLLEDDRTSVASEDTVVYTATCWMEKQVPAVTKQQQQQLVGVLRLPHCTPTYLASAVAPATSWLRRAGLKEEEALGLCTLPTVAAIRNKRLAQMYQDRVSWQLPARPASSVEEVVLQWQLPLCKLEEAVRSKGDISFRPEESRVTWRGRCWGVCIEAPHNRLGLFLLSGANPAQVVAECTVQSTSGRGMSRTLTDGYIEGHGVGRGFPKMLEWGADKDWPQVKAWLAQKQLVQPDGCLHLRIAVSQVC